jgi:iron complex outermembrane receptor protein
VLYGEAPPGGLINQVTKRPLSEKQTEITALFGSYDRRQGSFDTTGSFDPKTVWRYRLLGLIRNSGTQTNFTPDNRRLISPALTWHPSDRTNITILGDWQDDGNRWSQFLPSQGTLYNDNPNGIIPVDTFLGEPGLEFALRDQGSIGYPAITCSPTAGTCTPTTASSTSTSTAAPSTAPGSIQPFPTTPRLCRAPRMPTPTAIT